MQWKTIKNEIGRYCASKVPNSGTIGLGSGTTSEAFIRALGERTFHEPMKIQCVCSSKKTEEIARASHLPIISIEQWDGTLTILFDGADAIDAQGTAIKGAGGALVREKILAKAAERVVLMVDERKWLLPWQKCQLPLAIIPFGKSYVQRELVHMQLPHKERIDFLTDDHLNILDVSLKSAPLETIDYACKQITGVVETGLFHQLATEIVIGYADGKIDHNKL